MLIPISRATLNAYGAIPLMCHGCFKDGMPFSCFEEQRFMSQQSSETGACCRRVFDQVERQIRNCTGAMASMGFSNFLAVRGSTVLRCVGWEVSARLAGRRDYLE
jgi:hypothetical protein